MIYLSKPTRQLKINSRKKVMRNNKKFFSPRGSIKSGQIYFLFHIAHNKTMSIEKPYVPSSEEMKNAKENMTEEEKKASMGREAAFDAGYEKREGEMKTIICEEQNKNFNAYIEGEPENSGWGNSEYEALGNFISKNKELFGIKTKSVKKPDTMRMKPYSPPSGDNPFSGSPF